MKVRSLRISNFRAFADSGEINLANINVLIGSNNSGKTSVLRALNLLQEGMQNPFADIRIGCPHSIIEIDLDEVSESIGWRNSGESESCKCRIQLGNPNKSDTTIRINVAFGPAHKTQVQLKNIEPNNFIVPVLSKRKTINYDEHVGERNAFAVENDMRNLAAKLSRIANPQFPRHDAYAKACEAILGFVVTTIPSANGQRPGVYLPDMSSISIDQMGEGVPNVVHMLVNLVVSTGKLFLIEEPENDLHPYALKALLNLIEESSKHNQFVISTHSNIVVSHLCGKGDSNLFRVSSDPKVLPNKANIECIDSTPEFRISILQELGYSFVDFDLWDGWLILEESSAERIIRDYLVPWFAPKLSRIRTLSANGVSKLEATFEDLNRLILFAHLQPAYKNKAWVVADGDNPGRDMIDKLRLRYNSWDRSNFQNFKNEQFERYYPREFSEKIERVLVISDKEKKRTEKKSLLMEVVDWLDSDPVVGKMSLKESAAEIIQILREIESKLGLS